MQEPLETLVRQVDEDRWLAGRFAQRLVRPKLMAVYALNYEISRTAWSVTNETLGDIRLAFWRDAIADIHAGKAPPAHPALEAYAASEPNAVMGEAWAQLIAAREKDLEAVPFETWPDLQAYVEATAGNVFRIAIETCLTGDDRHKQLNAFALRAGQVWGYAGLVRALPHWTTRRSTFFPRKLLEHVGLTTDALFAGDSTHAVRSAAMAVVDRARHAYREAQDLASVLPAAAFPGYGYLALAPRYLRAVSMPEADPNASHAIPLLVRQIALVTASAMGRV
ncbi:MAG: squalene/phytoene synthase family protein [Caulobacterales bacterium]